MELFINVILTDSNALPTNVMLYMCINEDMWNLVTI